MHGSSAGLSFRPQNRLNNSQAFSSVFAEGKRFYLKMGMYIFLTQTLATPRFGLIVAKKKLRKAHQRNYLKRIQRECFRQTQSKFSGYDIVFVAHHKVNQLCPKTWFALAQADWQALAKRLASS